MFVETAEMTVESRQFKAVKSTEKSLFIQEDDTASRKYSSEEKKAVPIPILSKKEALPLSGETLKLS